MSEDRRFGIAYADPDKASDPAPGDVGCVAHILNTQSLSGGRSDILTTGERRFVLLEWLASERPYRMARVEEFGDEPVEAAEAEGIGQDVRRDFLRVMVALEQEPAELPVDPEALSFRVAASLELETPGKLALLAIRSTTVRLRRLAALLQPLAADAERRAEVRHRARSNGKGGAHPQIEKVP
jgi:Lon protease-like protein